MSKLLKEFTVYSRPCSTNQITRTFRNIQIKNKKAKDFEKLFIKHSNNELFDFPMLVDVKFYINRFNVTDVDNLNKNVMDSLQNNGIIKNDSLIYKIIAEKVEVKKNADQKVEIKIYKWEE